MAKTYLESVEEIEEAAKKFCKLGDQVIESMERSKKILEKCIDIVKEKANEKDKG